MLRIVTWKISSENEDVAILGKCVLESIGCDNRHMLPAKCSKSEGGLILAKKLQDDESRKVVNEEKPLFLSRPYFTIATVWKKEE